MTFLAKLLGISQQSITITRGEASRHKRLLIIGLEEKEILERFPKEGDLFQ